VLTDTFTVAVDECRLLLSLPLGEALEQLFYGHD
jgi:hypothetical protein